MILTHWLMSLVKKHSPLGRRTLRPRRSKRFRRSGQAECRGLPAQIEVLEDRTLLSRLFTVETSFSDSRLTELDADNGAVIQTFDFQPNVLISGLAYDSSTGTLFGFDDGLYSINVATGGFSLVGSSSVSVSGLAVQPGTADLFGITLGGSLYQINKNNAATTFIGGEFNLSFAHGLAFHPDGRLFASDTVGEGTSQLFQINPSTGAATFVAEIDRDFVVGLEFDSAGTLYATDNGTRTLITVDVTSGTATTVGALNSSFGYAGGVVFVDDGTQNGGGGGENGGGGGASVEDFETGDFSAFPWVTSGNAGWFVTQDDSNSGTYSARAGVIDHNEQSILEVTLTTTDGDISFARRVSSESGWDFLTFSIDGDMRGEWSGQESSFTVESFPVTAGEHTFRWTYSKDGSVSHGLDTAFLDDIVFPLVAAEPPPVETDGFSENFDGVTAPALPDGWTTEDAAVGSVAWTTSTDNSFGGPNSAFVPNIASVSDVRLTTPVFTYTADGNQLTFQNRYDLEDSFDGGVLEISVNGGAFQDILAAGGSFVTGGYDAALSTSFSNPLGGRQAWTGNSAGYVVTTASLPVAAAGQDVQLRWRLGTDSSQAATGWWIDDIRIVEPETDPGQPPGDSFDTALDLGVLSGPQEPVQYSLQQSGAGHVFRFETVATGTLEDFVRIDFVHAAGDLDMELYDGQRNSIDGSLGSGDFEQISLLDRPAGTYYLQVFGLNDATNDYTLTINAPAEPGDPGSPVQPGDSFETALDLGSGDVSFEGAIASFAEHYFEWTAETGGLATFTVSSPTPGANLNFRVFTAGLTEIAEGDFFGGSASPANAAVSAGQSYFVRIDDWAGIETAYTLSITVDSGEPGDPGQPGGSLETALDLGVLSGPQEPAEYSIQQPEVDHWFRFETAVTGTLEDFVRIDFVHADGDLDMALYDDQGDLIDDSTSSNNFEDISLLGLSAGTYYLRVSGFGGATNDYTLTINAPGQPGDPTPIDGVIAVTTFADVVDPNDGLWSLREAVLFANSNAGDTVIQLQAGTYWLTIQGADEDAAARGDLDILDNGNVTIVGAGAGQTIIHAGGNGTDIPALGDRVFHVHSGASLTVNGVTITGGTAIGDFPNSVGGGIFNEQGTLTVTNSTLSGNSADEDGGGIGNVNGTLVVANSTFSGNSAGGNGGGIFHVDPGLDDEVSVTNSTFFGNSAGNIGGGIATTVGVLTVTNSTISGNSADSFGGGIAHQQGTLAVTNGTIFGNRADANGSDVGGGGGISGPVAMANTIVVGNRRGAPGSGDPDDIDGTFGASGSFNLIGDANSAGGLTDGVNGNIVGVDVATVLETTLADNGGPTLTHALLAGSPAINAGDPEFTPPPDFDQRGDGFARVVDGRIDIGALEFAAMRFALVDGDLIIEDLTGDDDNWVLRLNEGVVELLDANDGHALLGSQALADITGQILVNAGNGDDVLTLDFTGGDLTPAGGISYSGGGGRLVLVSGAFGASTFTSGNAGEGSIRLDLDGDGESVSTITYAGLEAITSEIVSDVVELVYAGGDETITVADAGEGRTAANSTLGTTTTFVNPTELLKITATDGSDVLNVNSLAEGYASLEIRGDGATDAVNFHGSLIFAADHGLTVSEVGTVHLTGEASHIGGNGGGRVDITALRNILLASGSGITTEGGDITLRANQDDENPSGGSFVGIDIDGSVIQAAVGEVTLHGRGGDMGADQHGVRVQNGGQVLGEMVDVVGHGGGSDEDGNYGVLVTGTGSRITTSFNEGFRPFGGIVFLTGVGGGTGDSQNNVGVFVQNSGRVTSEGGIGSIEIYATAGGGNGGAFHLTSAGTVRTDIDNGGTISITADSMSLESANGINANNGSGRVWLGTETWGTAVNLGGDDAAGTLGLTNAELDTIAASLIQISGIESTMTVTSAIQHAGDASFELHAQRIVFAADWTTTHGRLQAHNGFKGANGNYIGIDVDGATITSLGSGDILLSGDGGNTGDGNYGLRLHNGAVITSTDTGPIPGIISVSGGSHGGVSNNHGLFITGADTRVVSAGGEIVLGGNGAQVSGENIQDNHGIEITGGALVQTGGDGEISLWGGTQSDSSSGVSLAGSARVSTANGAISIGGWTVAPENNGHAIQLRDGARVTSTTGTVTLTADSMDIAAEDAIHAASGTVVLQPQTAASFRRIPIIVGGDDILNDPVVGWQTLGLTQAELDRINAGTIIIGNADSGTITISTAISHAGDANFHLVTGRNIVFNAGSDWTSTAGNLTFSANQQMTPTGGDFVGIDVNGVTIGSSSGAITLQGRGANDPAGSQHGVLIHAGAMVGQGTTGAVTVAGQGGGSSGDHNDGVLVIDSQITTSGFGRIEVSGTGGGVAGSTTNRGVVLDASRITADNGAVSVEGFGGILGSGENNTGVLLTSTNSRISSSGGNVEVAGSGGNGGEGVLADVAGEIIAGRQVTLVGAGGTLSGHGVQILLGAVSAGNGGIDITGTAGGGVGPFGFTLSGDGGLATSGTGDIRITADSMDLDAGIDAGSNTVTLRQQTDGTQIEIDSTDNDEWLSLTKAELNRITAAALVIGNSASGHILVDNHISLALDLSLESGGALIIHEDVTLEANALVVKAAAGIFTGSGLLKATVGDMALHTTDAAIGAINAPVNVQVAGQLSLITEAPGGDDGDIFVAAVGTLLIGTIASGEDPDLVHISSTGDLTVAAGSNLNDDVQLTAAGTINLGFEGTFQTNSIQATAGGNIQGSGSVQATAAGVILIAVEGGLGSDGTPVNVLIADGGTLITTSNGDQYIATVGTLAVGNLDAGDNTITLALGQFRLTNDDGISDAGTLAILTDAVLDLDTFNEIIDQLVLDGGLILADNGTITPLSGSLIISGEITGLNGDGGLVVQGPGNKMSGDNPYTGDTVLANNGQLALEPPFTAVNSHFVIEDGELTGGGAAPDEVVTGDVTAVGPLAILIPGQSPGILTTGSLTMNAGAQLHMEVFGPTPGNSPDSHDQLFVRGTVNIDGAVLFVDFGEWVPDVGDEVLLIANDGTDAVIGEFAGLTEGALVATLDDKQVVISYAGGDGNDVSLLVLPPALTVLQVDTFADVVNPDDGLTSLREAIIHANSTAGDFEIRLAEGTYYLTLGGANNNDGQTGDLDILNNGSVTIVGAGAGQTVIHAGGFVHPDDSAQNIPALGDRVFHVHLGASLTVEGLTVSGGVATGAGSNNQGGGFLVNGGTLVVNAAEVAGNRAGVGGGIYNTGAAGSVTVSHSTLSANQATGDGGGIFNQTSGSVSVVHSTLFQNQASGLGGGIFNQSAGSVDITNSTLAGNQANTSGGGFYNTGTGSSVTVANSTLSGNQANTSGGGIYNIAFASATVTNSTITGNRADANGSGSGVGGGLARASGTVTLHNTIVAGNFVGTDTVASDIAGTSVTGTFNLIGNAGTAGGLSDGTGGNIVGNNGTGTLDIATVLDTTLADNGGPTLTHALVVGSPAIDAGSNDRAVDQNNQPLTTDQRGAGFLRIVDGNGDSTATVDIGAFEFVPQVVPPTISFELVDGDLVIEDLAGNDDDWVLRLNGDMVELLDANDGDAILGSQALAAITGQIIIVAGDGDDLLTLDFAGGNPIAIGGISYAGGSIRLRNGTFGTTTFTSVDADEGSIHLDLDGDGQTVSTITYAGLDAITSDIVSNVVELVYAGGDETITVADASDGRTAANSTLGTMTTFVSPTELLKVTATNGTHTINVNTLADDYASLEVRGNGVADVVNFNGSLLFAADHGLTVSDIGTVHLTGDASRIGGNGGGMVRLDVLKNITLASGASITTQDGDITLSANQQETPTEGSFVGIDIDGATIEATGSGDIFLSGRGGDVGADQHGLLLRSGGYFGGAGTIFLRGMTSPGSDDSSFGVVLNDGTVQTTEAGNITVVADSMSLDSAASIDAGSNTVTIRPETAGTIINIGGADTAGTLGLTDAELDRITAGTINIGDANSGTITVSAPVERAAGTHLNLTTGGDIAFVGPGSLHAGGSNLSLNASGGAIVTPAGTAGVVHVTAGTIAVEGTLAPGGSSGQFVVSGDLVLGDAVTYAVELDDTEAGTGYDQIHVTGGVSLGGATLSVSRGFLPADGTEFVIIQNDGENPVSGTFDGLAEGDMVVVDGRVFTISYVGGDGNDVVLTAVNRPPVLDVPDWVIGAAETLVIDLGLFAFDPDADPLSYAAELIIVDPLEALAWELKQSLELAFTGNYWTDFGGAGEKWMQSDSGTWYFITPEGTLHEWAGARPGMHFLAGSPLVAVFDAEFFDDPSRLHEAVEPVAVVEPLSVTNDLLTVTPPEGFLGDLLVEVSADDGQAVTVQTFTVTVLAERPILNVPDLTRHHAAGPLVIDLADYVSEPHAGQVSFEAELVAGDPLDVVAWELKQSLGLAFTGDYSTNWARLGEKWMQGEGGVWYFLTPDGSLHQWTGIRPGASNFLAASPQVAVLDASFFADPSKLHDAAEPVGGGPNAVLDPDGSVLTIRPAPGFVGDLTVRVTVSDMDSETEVIEFRVSVTNTPPVLAIPDFEIPHTQDELLIDLGEWASDADGDPLSFTAELAGADPLELLAWELNESLGLSFTGSYSTGWGGAGEKWLQSASQTWYFITPEGHLHQWTGTRPGMNLVARSPLVAVLDASFHADPSKLHAAVEPVSGSPGDASVSLVGPDQTELRIVLAAEFVGDLRIRVTADDGAVTTETIFRVTVTGDVGIASFSDGWSSGEEDEGEPGEFGDEEFDAVFSSLEQDEGWSLFDPVLSGNESA